MFLGIWFTVWTALGTWFVGLIMGVIAVGGWIFHADEKMRRDGRMP